MKPDAKESMCEVWERGKERGVRRTVFVMFDKELDHVIITLESVYQKYKS